MGATGSEQPQDFPKETLAFEIGGNKSGNNRPDPELAAVVAAWPELPAAVRAGIVAMAKAAVSPAGGEGER